MGHPALMFSSKNNRYSPATCKNGPRMWIKCNPEAAWMVPKEITFRCGEIYEYIGYSRQRRSAYYQRKVQA